MSSDVSINTTLELNNLPKVANKPPQNIPVECTDKKPPVPKIQESKHVGHRRSHSNTPSSGVTVTYQHFNSYQQLPSSDNQVLNYRESVSNNDILSQDLIKDADTFNGVKNYRSDDSPINRLLIVSSKVRNISSIRHALQYGVLLIQYSCDSQTLDDILILISQSVNGRKLQSVGFIFSCSGSSLLLVTKEEKCLHKDGVIDKMVQEFFMRLVQTHFVSTDTSCRIDLFGWYSLQYSETSLPVIAELQNITGVSVGIWRDLAGNNLYQKRGEDVAPKGSAGELYFRLEKLRNWSGRHQQSLAGFEKIRTVGKGAYGAAVLYKKKDDESLVILKEINMHDLNASERQLALNEVSVLAMLDHPNIISYYDSFEEDGVLMIEMEYADNGTLAQYLAKQERPLVEQCILGMFQQMVAAIRHIHLHNILHRDLKTENIFLTKEGVIKIGDFGISKMMGSTNIGAQTVLGTPYYISPEMCEGKQYSFKSDIWALGCILYEMACLQKTFEGSNLPAVVNKIMKGQFAPLKGNFSEEFKEIVTVMLKKNPEERPEAQYIMYNLLPKLINKNSNIKSDQDDTSGENQSNKGKFRSVLYYLECSSTILTCINDLPPRMKIKVMAIGSDHVIVTTTERQVFSWGFGGNGQLGHGDTKDRHTPTPVEGLKGKSVTMCCCGLGFSIFGSDNGLVLTCGDGRSGCLGHGDWCSTTRPRLIESLLSVDVMAMASGMSHVVVIGRAGQVLSWGDGSCGQLGLGSEENYCIPALVHITDSVIFNNVQCGVDGTMLISDVGGVYACGNNENNKLGLNNRQGFLKAMKNIFTKTEVDGSNTPTPVRALARHRVLAVSMGVHHTAVIVEPGHVITFGRNSEGQLGTSNTKSSNAPVEVKALEGKVVNRIQCGEHYTIASTKDHELYYWGLRYNIPPAGRFEDTTSQSSCNESSSCLLSSLQKDDMRVESVTPLLNSSNGSQMEDKDEADKKTISGSGSKETKECSQTINQSEVDMQGFRPISSIPRRSLSASSQENSKDREKDKEMFKDGRVIIYEPTEIIKLKQSNEKMLLGNIYCHGENLFIQVETTAPPPRRRTFKKRILRRKSGYSLAGASTDSLSHMSSTARRNKMDENSCSSETSEMDTHSDIPAWLKEELAQSAVDINDGNEADDTSAQSEEDWRTSGIDSSMSSIQINRALTPVIGENNFSSRSHQPNYISPRDQNYKAQIRNRTYSANSSESNIEQQITELLTDSSSGEPSQIKQKTQELNSKLPPETKNTSKQARLANTQVKLKETSKGRAKVQPVVFRQRTGTRGFISDVTVKRREESLLFELDRVKQEKRQADARVRMLERERESQQLLLKQEAEKLAKEREKLLQTEVEKLRLEIEAQNSLLQDHKRVVGELQQQLNVVMTEQLNLGCGTTPRTPREQVDTSNQFTSRTPRSCEEDETSSNQTTPRPKNYEWVSRKKISKICSMQ